MEESNLYPSVTKNKADDSSKGENLPASSESADVYDNIFPVEMSTAGTSLSGAQDVKKTYRIATLCLGLLCALLLAGLIVLSLLHTKHVSEWISNYEELSISYSNVTKDRNQLKTTFNNLANEKQQLQKSLEQLTKWRDNLYRRLQAHGWVYFKRSLYFVSSLTGSWDDGRADCQSRGADLMIFNSGNEKDFAGGFRKYLWVGLTDTKTPKTWKWLDGTPLDTSYWSHGEPNQPNEHCAAINHVRNGLYDAVCRSRLNWICEKRFDL